MTATGAEEISSSLENGRPTTNGAASTRKYPAVTTSLVSVIATTDLLYSVQLIYSVNYRTIPLLIVACSWYLIVTTVLSIGQYYLERYFGRGATRALPATPIQRLRRNLFTFRRATVEAPAPKNVEMPKGSREGR